MGIQISTAEADELDRLLMTPNMEAATFIDLNALPVGTIVRLKTMHFWKYLLQIGELDGKRVVHVVLSDRTGSYLGSAKYRGASAIEPDYAILARGKKFKYGKILTAVLSEVNLFQ